MLPRNMLSKNGIVMQFSNILSLSSRFFLFFFLLLLFFCFCFVFFFFVVVVFIVVVVFCCCCFKTNYDMAFSNVENLRLALHFGKFFSRRHFKIFFQENRI